MTWLQIMDSYNLIGQHATQRRVLIDSRWNTLSVMPGIHYKWWILAIWLDNILHNDDFWLVDKFFLHRPISNDYFYSEKSNWTRARVFIGRNMNVFICCWDLITLLGRCVDPPGILDATAVVIHFCFGAVDPTCSKPRVCLYPAAKTDKACVLDTDTVT